MDMDKKERSSDQVEDVNAEKLSVHDGTLIMPASLAALSQEDYEKVGKKATLKMDMVIMPIMVSHPFNALHLRGLTWDQVIMYVRK